MILKLPGKVPPRYSDRVVLTADNINTTLELAGHSRTGDTRVWLIDSLELSARRMISHCAVHIHIPYTATGRWLRPRKIMSVLSPTSKKHILFVDQRHLLWNSIVAYLKPLADILGDSRTLLWVTWDLYVIALASRYRAELVMSPKRTLSLIRQLDNLSELNAGCHARLATIAGILNCFKENSDGPYLRFLPDATGVPISERLEEIMEDAYLLEASRLRRFLGVKQNVASIKRDLRKILSHICQKSAWAKGLVGIGSATIRGGHGSAKALEKLINIIPSLGSLGQQPVLTNIGFPCISNQETCVQVIRGISGENYYIYPRQKRFE